MKKLFILLFAAALLLAAPTFAQTEPELEAEATAEIDAEPVQNDAEMQEDGVQATAEAKLSADVDSEEPQTEDVTAEAEMNLETEGDFESESEIDAEVSEDRELPQTAGFLPLLALLGLGSLAAALGLRSRK